MENNEEIDIKRIIEIIFSKKLIITLIILLSVTLGYVYSYYYKKPEYKSSVTILLVADENKTDKSLTQTDVNLNNGLISTYSSIAKSSSILQKTIQNLNLDIPVSKLEQNVEAKQIDNTQFLEISVKNESPERAKNIANELAEVFTEQIKEIYNLQNISIVDKAETEENPCNINHMKDMIIFGFAGIVLSIIIVMVIYMFDDTVKDQKDIEKNIKLRIIGTLPVDREKTELIVENNPKSPIVESIKTIRTNILYSTRKNSILVTSCKEKEGKSWVINNLAVTFAQTGKRVILVDANLRQENNKNEIFNIEKCEGLSDFIREISEDQMENLEKARKYIKETSIPNLHIMQFLVAKLLSFSGKYCILVLLNASVTCQSIRIFEKKHLSIQTRKRGHPYERDRNQALSALLPPDAAGLDPDCKCRHPPDRHGVQLADLPEQYHDVHAGGRCEGSPCHRGAGRPCGSGVHCGGAAVH